MVIDTSALLAILPNEPERDSFVEAIFKAGRRLMSAVSVVEGGMVLESRRAGVATDELMRALQMMDIEIVSVDRIQAQYALLGFRRYGKGRHPAALNFGDCFTYALAVTSREPLLAKGVEFRRADLELCS